MSNSDKDFITRIQVSQLVTDDPYADDFYFHIMAAIKMSRHNAAMAAGAPPGMLMPNGQMAPGIPAPVGGAQRGGGGGGGNRKPTRRENAMNKMAQNVQRLVDVAKQRNQKGQRAFISPISPSSLLPPLTRLNPASKSPSTALSARSPFAPVPPRANSSKSNPVPHPFPPPPPAQPFSRVSSLNPPQRRPSPAPSRLRRALR